MNSIAEKIKKSSKIYFIIAMVFYCLISLIIGFAIKDIGLGIIVTIVSLPICGVVMYCFFNMYRLVTAKAYEYSLGDLYFSHRTCEYPYQIEVGRIAKQKDRDDIYEVSFTSSKYYGFKIEKELTKQEYDDLIGEGNNTFSNTAYDLTFAVPVALNLESNTYYLHIIRSSFMGEIDFTDEEIKEYASLSLDVFNNLNKSEFRDYDLSRISGYNSHTYIKVDCHKDCDLNNMRKFKI